MTDDKCNITGTPEQEPWTRATYEGRRMTRRRASAAKIKNKVVEEDCVVEDLRTAGV